MIVCNKCKLEKELEEFSKNNKCCKFCVKEYNKEYYKKNQEYFKEKRKEWNENNREYKNDFAKKKYHENKEYFSEKAKEYRNENRKRLNDSKKEWERNRSIEEKRRYRNEYSSRKRKEDSFYNLKCLIRSYISSVLKQKGFKKSSKTEYILGCSFKEFKVYLESKFESWMTWENKGLYNGEFNYGWDIDHIIPISSAKTEEDILRLNHFTNLQPLCSKINRDIKRFNLF
jgi:hypothetical protein